MAISTSSRCRYSSSWPSGGSSSTNSRKDPFKSTSCSSSGLPCTCFSNSAWAALRSISFSSTASPSRSKASAKRYNRFANFCGLSFSGSYGRLKTSFSFSTDGSRKTDSSPMVEEAPDGAARAARPPPPSPPWLGPAGSGPGPAALRSSSLSSSSCGSSSSSSSSGAPSPRASRSFQSAP